MDLAGSGGQLRSNEETVKPPCRFLPRPMVAVGAWYLLTGLICLSLGDARALSPWAMGIPFGVGQLLVAAVLLFTTQEGVDEA